MVITNDFQCNVCDSITRIKVQLGWLENYPVRIKCGKCNISIFGNVYLDQPNVGYSIKLKNVTPLEEIGKPDYLIEVSGELLTEKMRPYTGDIDTLFSPFFKNGVFSMGENIEKFKERTIRFLHKIEYEWPTVKRINELWFNGNHTYLPKEIHKLIDKTQFPADNELELLRAVHFLNSMFTNTFASNYFKGITSHIFKELGNINEKNQLFLLAQHFENQLDYYEHKLFAIINKFIDKFHMFIPVYGLDFYEEKNDKEKSIKNLGLTTVDFEDIKDFYIDTFEDIGDILNLMVAYNNLSHRADYKKMKENVIKDILNIEDFIKMRNKGRKLEFITGEENFDKIFVSKVDNRLRNAIGHRSYTYDVISQELTYYPSGDQTKGTSESLNLTEFVLECFQLMRSCIGLAEIVYQTRKFMYVKQGIIPRTLEDYFPSSIEKNLYNNTPKNKKRSLKKNKKKISKKARQNNRKK
ncbi:metal-binding protein [Neobacillus niacini]|uniref:metal-binding protein n=1 Tax=Neobacillus niacini TaxID=86668 RepID=UPI001C8D62B2|nr:metal-binding protein [Neobacillus niacini]MBY0144322.1 metal-binding protein [Neobacillus niacini]